MNDLIIQFVRLWGQYESLNFTDKDRMLSNVLKSYDSTELSELVQQWAQEFSNNNEFDDTVDFFEHKIKGMLQILDEVKASCVLDAGDLMEFISDYRGEEYLNLSNDDFAKIENSLGCFEHIYSCVKDYLEEEGITFDDVDVSHYSSDEYRFVLLDIVAQAFKEYKECPDLYQKPTIDSLIQDASSLVEKKSNTSDIKTQVR